MGDDLYAGGTFTQIGGQTISSLARWDGSKWHPVGEPLSLGDGPPPVVTDIVPYEGGLFITGTFHRAGAALTRRLAWYDGQKLVELGGGLSDLGESLLVQDDKLFVGCTFLTAGDRVSSGIALWQL